MESLLEVRELLRRLSDYGLLVTTHVYVTWCKQSRGKRGLYFSFPVLSETGEKIYLNLGTTPKKGRVKVKVEPYAVRRVRGKDMDDFCEETFVPEHLWHKFENNYPQLPLLWVWDNKTRLENELLPLAEELWQAAKDMEGRDQVARLLYEEVCTW